ncbi:MAG TPA: response regulator [Pyrinomonadaceae bacterium]|nr:response regulator [Pyrinomonadaceae bacterium]
MNTTAHGAAAATFHAAPPEALPEAAPAPATVLLAEDDRAVRRYLEVVLRRLGYHGITAADGLEAMKAALSNDVDAVVTDAVMPHLGGAELCRFLRAHPRLSRLPVLLLSGAESPAGGAADEQADAYLPKPVRAEELAARLARMLDRAG